MTKQEKFIKHMKQKYSYLTSFLSKRYIVFVLLLALFLRLYKIDGHGFGFDEGVSLLIANGIYDRLLFFEKPFQGTFSSYELNERNNLDNVFKSTANDNGNSILYNVILHFWVNLMSNSTFSARVLSVIFDILTIYYMYLFSSRIFPERKRFLALVACTIGAFNPLFIFLAQQARAYSLATLLGLISSYYFFKIVHLREVNYKYFLYYALSVTGTLLCHYLSVVLFLGHFIVFLLYERSFSNWLRMFLVSIFVVVTLLVWLYYGGMEGYGHIQRVNQYYMEIAKVNTDGKLSNYVLPLNLRNLVGGILQNWLIDFGIGLQYCGLRIREFGILILIPILIILQALIDDIYRDKKKIISLVVIFFCHTLLAIILAIKYKHIVSFLLRYSHFVLPYAHILLALGIDRLCEKKKLIAIMSLIFTVGMSLLGAISYYYGYGPFSEKPAINYKELAKSIEKEYTPNDMLLVKSLWHASLINLHLDKKREFFIRIESHMEEIYKISKK